MTLIATEHEHGTRSSPTSVGVAVDARRRAPSDCSSRSGLESRRSALDRAEPRRAHLGHAVSPSTSSRSTSAASSSTACRALKPWRIRLPRRGTAGVLELPAGTLAASGTTLGHRIVFEASEDRRARQLDQPQEMAR